MKQVLAWAVFAGILFGVGPASGATVGDCIQVEVRTDGGPSLPLYPTAATYGKKKIYAEAVKGKEYTVVIRNLLPRRVGLVVAVDGRNIISGARSELARGEPMYVLGPYETQEYSGWRTSLSDVHEFFFTDWKDSYAEAFGDRSARGVIAIAVYRERERVAQIPEPQPYAKGQAANAAPASPAAGVAADARRSDSKESEPGTGFGERRYEPTVRVEFDAERLASSKVFLKYEWAEALCRKGIIQCDPERNRFWNDDLAFAPFPPG